jgi:hypothetical protein
MSLLTQQRQLLALLQAHDPATSPDVADDAYLAQVAGSEALDVTRYIGLWWREYSIEQWCALTCALLKQRGTFTDTVRQFSMLEGLSRYIEEVGDRFLDAMCAHPDSLVASVAGFERALIRAAQGDAKVRVIEWDRDPARVVASLVERRPIEDCPVGRYRTRVSPQLPQLFEIESA